MATNEKVTEVAIGAMKALYEKRLNAKLKRVEKAVRKFESFYTAVRGALGTASFGDIKFGGTVMEFVFTHPDYEGHSFRFATDLDGDRDTIHAEVTEVAEDGEKIWDYCGTIDGKADPVTSVNRIFAAIAKWDK